MLFGNPGTALQCDFREKCLYFAKKIFLELPTLFFGAAQKI